MISNSEELAQAMKYADIEFSRAKVQYAEENYPAMTTSINRAIRYLDVARFCSFGMEDLVA